MSFISMDNKHFSCLLLWGVLNFKKNLPSMLPMFDYEEMEDEEDEINFMNKDWILCFVKDW